MINKVINRFTLASNVLLHGSLPVMYRSPIPTISPDEVAEARGFFPLEIIFIFGHARSGTTLLTRLIRLHPDVHCNYQGHFFTRKPTIEALVNQLDIESWLTRRSNRWNHGKDLSPVVLRAVVDFIMEREARPLGAKIVGDKSPNNLLDGEAVKLLHKVYPDGKLIFIIRDGRDATISHRFQTFIDATQHLTVQDKAVRSDFQHEPEPYLHGNRSIFTEHGIHNAAEGWSRNIRDTDHQGRNLFGKQYISLRFEDLLADPWKELNHFWSFLEVDTKLPELPELIREEFASNPDKAWQREKAGDLVGPHTKGVSGSWQNLFTLRDKQVFHDIASETLSLWGYTKSLD